MRCHQRHVDRNEIPMTGQDIGSHFASISAKPTGSIRRLSNDIVHNIVATLSPFNIRKISDQHRVLPNSKPYQGYINYNSC